MRDRSIVGASAPIRRQGSAAAASRVPTGDPVTDPVGTRSERGLRPAQVGPQEAGQCKPSVRKAEALPPGKKGFRRTLLIPISVVTLLVMAAGAAQARPRSVEELAQKSKDPLVRESAVQVLGQRGSARSAPLLIERLAKDDNLWVRARAAQALGQMGAAAAIRPLRSALAREKSQRVRRMVAAALVRLGQRAGVEELMWQLESGTNYSKAEVMELFVAMFGAPLGQQTKAWWAYLSRAGNALLAHRPAGSPALQQLGEGARLFGKLPDPGWREVPAVVVTLRPTRAPVTPAQLRGHSLPDGALLLIRTQWRLAKIKVPATAKAPGRPQGPGLTLEAARYILERAPNLVGVGIDAPALDPGPGDKHPVRELLVSGDRLALEGLDKLDHIVASGTRLLVVDRGGAAADGGRQVLLLGLLR